MCYDLVIYWYDYMKPNYGENAKLCNMNTDSSIFYKKAEDITQIFQKMLEQGLIFQIINQIDHYLKQKIKMLLQ